MKLEKGIYVRVYGTMTGTTVDGLTVDIPEMGRDLRLMDIYAFFYDEDGLRDEVAYYRERPCHG